MSSDWEAILRDVIKDPCYDRPFVCNYNGFPDECNVVFVGQCPKHPLRNINWWDFWDWGSGFNYNGFVRAYKQSTSKTSRTRRFYSELREELGCKSIETNVCRSAHNHDEDCFCNFEMLKMLFKNLPQEKRIGIVFHGRKAQKRFCEFTALFSEKWAVIPPLERHLGRYDAAEDRERVKEFCKDLMKVQK